MKLLPLENITFKTQLPSDEVISRLDGLVEPEKGLRFSLFNSASTKPYEGQIYGQTFRMKRIIGYRNSFLPRIKGVVSTDYDGTTIRVTMRLHVVVLVFLCFWCGFIGLVCLGILSRLSDDAEGKLVDLVPFGMLGFAYALTMVAFKMESIRAKKVLQRAFEADILS